MNYRRATGACVLAATMVAGVVAAVGAVFCQATLHVPRKVGLRPAGASETEITTSDNTRLKAWWFAGAANSRGCVMILHGIGDSRAGSAGFARMFLDAGYSVLVPDSRGHGRSDGQYITYGLIEKYDVAEWAEWAHAQGCKKVYGLGESLGGSILIQAAAVSPAFRAMVAECAFANLKEMGELRLRRAVGVPRLVSKGVMEAGLLYARAIDHIDLDDVDPLKSIGETRVPILLIHGLDDRRTPPEQSERLARAAGGRHELLLVPHAGHTEAFAVAPEEFRRRVIEWFESAN